MHVITQAAANMWACLVYCCFTCLIMVCPVTVDRQPGVGILHHLFDCDSSVQPARCGHSASCFIVV